MDIISSARPDASVLGNRNSDNFSGILLCQPLDVSIPGSPKRKFYLRFHRAEGKPESRPGFSWSGALLPDGN